MKDYHKNPNFYYVAIPVITAVWMLFVWTVSMPAADKKKQDKIQGYHDTFDIAVKILKLDPDRLNYDKSQSGPTEFDYTAVVDQFAKACGIAASRYSINVRPVIKRAGRSTQSADVNIDTVDVETLAKFLSTLLSRWPELQCDTLRLLKQNAGPDAWKITMKFTYYY